MTASSSSQRLKGILSVTVLQAKNLKRSDWFGENDCYAVVSIELLSTQGIIKANDKKQQTETYQKAQIHEDDLLAYGTLDLLDDEKIGRFYTNFDKEWLHTVTISMLHDKVGEGGTVELLLHFIPETVAAYLDKKFDTAQAELKKKLTQEVVGKMPDVASDKIRGYVGIGV